MEPSLLIVSLLVMVPELEIVPSEVLVMVPELLMVPPELLVMEPGL